MKETTLTAHQTGEIVNLICREASDGLIRVCTVEEAAQTVKARTEREEARLGEYLAAQAAREARIRELEAAIREIYSHWDD